MKIGIVGNYGHDNNGDEAILLGIIKQLTEELGVAAQNIVIFSNHPENTLDRYGFKSVTLLHKRSSLLGSIFTTIFHNHKIIRDLDLLIIGGGGLLMDMYKRDAPLYTAHAIMGKLTRCQVIVYGVGAGPISTKMGRILIKSLVTSASSVSLRDAKSKELLRSIGVKKELLEIADPALQLGKNSVRKPSSQIRRIGITAVPYFSKAYWPNGDEGKYQSYLHGFAQNIDQLIDNHGVHITFFSTKYPQDVQVTKDIFALIRNKDGVTLLEDNLYPDEIVTICQQQDIIIGTRLHSLILSVASQTPIIGIGYHQKVQDFMIKIGKEKYFVDIHDLKNNDIISNLVGEYKQNWLAEQEEYSTIHQEQQKGIDEGIKQIRQAFKSGDKNG